LLDLWLIIVAFIFGTIIGSFLNVVVLRLGTGESIVYGRSRCYLCGKNLSWYELVPLFSFLVQGGHCRSCLSRISSQYAIVEFLTGAIFTAVLYEWWLNTAGVFGGFTVAMELIFWAAFIALVVYDVRHKILPDILSAIIVGAALAYRIESGELVMAFLSAGAIAGFFALLWLVSRGRWMGLGDAKLFFGTSLFLSSFVALLAVLLSFWSGAIVGLALMASRRKVTMKTELPFAPFIFFGAIVARFWGEQIISWYLTLI
jgi:leader peptidase (prepilin peptidase)/N-methyltransferase